MMRFFLFSSQKGNKSAERIQSRCCDTFKKINKSCNDVEFFVVKNCNEAISTLASGYHYDVYIIALGHEMCYSNGVAEYCSINGRVKNKLILILEDTFSHGGRLNDMLFYPKDRRIHLRYKDLGSPIFTNIIRTIIDRPSIYISYGNDKSGRTRKTIETIYESCDKALPYVDIIYDANKLKLGDDVSVFMGELTSNTRIIIIMNDKYLKSPYGMGELKKIIENTDEAEELLANRILPISMESTDMLIRTKSNILPIKEYWQSEENKTKTEDDRQRISEIISLIDKIPDKLGSIYSLSIGTIEEENFIALLWAIHNRLGKDGYIMPYENDQELNKHLN